MYEKVALTTHIWHRAKCYFTIMSNAWYLISVPNMNKISTCFSEISQQTLKMYEEIAKITQICHRAKFYFTYMSSPWYLIMVPNNMKKIHPIIMEECFEDGWTDWLTGGWTDRLMHWTLSYFPQVSLGRVENNNCLLKPVQLLIKMILDESLSSATSVIWSWKLTHIHVHHVIPCFSISDPPSMMLTHGLIRPKYRLK